MCVLYVSLGSKVRPRTFECVALGSAVLFILKSRLLSYSGVNGVQVVLSMLTNFQMCGIMLVLEQCSKCESKRAYVF